MPHVVDSETSRVPGHRIRRGIARARPGARDRARSWSPTVAAARFSRKSAAPHHVDMMSVARPAYFDMPHTGRIHWRRAAPEACIGYAIGPLHMGGRARVFSTKPSFLRSRPLYQYQSLASAARTTRLLRRRLSIPRFVSLATVEPPLCDTKQAFA